MPLVVEDGTGLANSNAYISLDDAEAYYLETIGSAWLPDDEVKDAAIIRAARYLDGMRFKGVRTRKREQAMDWPRYAATDCDGTVIPSNEVPVEIARANALLAFFEAATPGGLDPNVTLTQLAKREKVDVIEVEYRDTQATAENNRPIITGAMDLIKCLTISGSQRFIQRA